ncbi:MAG: hypothetical protein IPK17_04930 [Chloroflexi bacterium]|uniref:hypothetical protein n=1 Tax=Candidatus Flexifilum breve TaxID=3140694 RepID=UPI00313752B2|nr:hypothetical protein [Chloroflexota bacterium]
MQSRQAVHIIASEWRWVIIVASGLILLAFAPLLWMALTGTSDWQFMGALHNYLDGATYLSKIVQGERGIWLTFFQHTPENYPGAFMQAIYPLLGHVSRIMSVPPMVIFHVARVFAALFMYISLYQLGAAVWTKIRARRVFFIIASLGSGLGWLFMPVFQDVSFPDITVPEAYPLYSTFVNVHFPLTIACLALLVGYFIMAFRPGADQDPSLDRAVPVMAILSVALAILYPHALVPFGGALAVFALFDWRDHRRLSPRLVRYLLALGLPALPIAVYYALIVTYNPGFAEWNRQNVNPAPAPLMLLIGLGLPLLIGIPGIIRGLLRFERDGDRLVVLWLIAMLIVMYLPTGAGRRCSVGMMLPIAYFATRAVEDVWISRISRRVRSYVFALVIPLIAVSQIFVLFLPVTLPALSGDPGTALGVFLEHDYYVAYQWVNEHSSSSDVVLASPVVSAWIPGWAETRVVYGHPFETLNAAVKRQQVLDWYAGTGDCTAILDEYNVRYVLYGVEEAKFGAAPCRDQLNVVAEIGGVTVYAR